MFERLLIANRGEIAVRIARAAAELDIATVAVCSEDDAASPHLRVMDQVVTLDGSGPAAYLNVAAVVRAARESDCDALHPGYGFLSERAELAAACGEAAITFVGPSPAVLERFGDKLAARDLAASAGVACIEGAAVEDDEQAAAFFAALAGAPMMVKAVAGGGGRGMRVVRSAGEITAALARCRSEAQAAFGRGELYVEAWWERPRHVEVQLLGDRHGGLVHLGDRDCSLQRRHQKLVEIAPAPHLPAAVRERLWADALVIGRAAELDNLATIEFLVGPDGRHAFIEANARLQVEHTITEAVYGVDVVQAQLRLAAGETVLAVGCDGAAVAPRGVAIQCRVNLEPPTTAGAEPVAFAVFEPPSGAGVRVDTFVTTDHAPSLRYDPLLAKVITHASGGTFAAAVRKAASAVGEFRVEGVDTNLAFLRQLLALDEVRAGDVHTQLVEQHAGELQAAIDAAPPPEPSAATSLRVGATIDPVDPLAVLELGRSTPSPSASAVPGGAAIAALELGDVAVPAPLQGTVVSVDVRAGDPVAAGQPLVVIEAMKMEHVVAAPASGVVRRVDAVVGATIASATIVVVIDATATGADAPAASREVDLDRVRADLAEVISRHEVGLDHARTDAVARRRRTGQRTARENIDDLVDPGSFVEYGPLVVAAQRRRRPLQSSSSAPPPTAWWPAWPR